jgi:hypothetical protein
MQQDRLPSTLYAIHGGRRENRSFLVTLLAGYEVPPESIHIAVDCCRKIFIFID